VIFFIILRSRLLTVSGLSADICKAGVESDPRGFGIVGRLEIRGRADQFSESHADSGVIERSISQVHKQPSLQEARGRDGT